MISFNAWLWKWKPIIEGPMASPGLAQYSQHKYKQSPDSKVHAVNMGPTWVLLAPDGPHVDLMNLAIRVTNGHDNSHHCHSVYESTSN